MSSPRKAKMTSVVTFWAKGTKSCRTQGEFLSVHPSVHPYVCHDRPHKWPWETQLEPWEAQARPGRPNSGPGRPKLGPGRPKSDAGRPKPGPGGGGPRPGPGRLKSGPGRPKLSLGRPKPGFGGQFDTDLTHGAMGQWMNGPMDGHTLFLRCKDASKTC